MKILFITNNFPPVIDGVGDYTYHLANELLIHNNEIHIICSKKIEIIERTIELESKNIFVHPIIQEWNKNGVNFVYQKIIEIAPSWVSLQYVPYAFHKYGIPFSIMLLAKKLFKTNIKFHTTFHEVAIRKNFLPLKHYIIALGQHYIAHNLVKYSNKAYTSNNYYNCLLKKKAKIVPIGSNIKKHIWEKEIDKINFRNSLVDKNEFIISTFSLRFNRGFESIIKTIKKLYQEKVNFKFIILGKLPADIRTGFNRIDPNCLQQHVIITGEQIEEMISKYLSITDLFVLQEEVNPKNEGGCCTKSGVLASAIEHKLPIIGTEGDMTDKILKNKGIIFTPYNNTEEIFNKILFFINKPSALQDLKIKNHTLFKDYLNWQNITDQYLQI